MGGEWNFSFRHENKDTFDVLKYQQLLSKLRTEYEPQFLILDTTEVAIKWLIEGKIPVNNVFAEFSYRCTKEHVDKGSGHGIWTLFWDPTILRSNNDLHARCAPMCFKEISNQIQVKLAKEFPDHFVVSWRNGLSGYEGCGVSAFNRKFETDVNCVLRQMLVAMEWNVSETRENDVETTTSPSTWLSL